mmetsp:Transcript_60913/g.199448  ORF Transcript_60913/g.199448 Transcript_60913/m.199448 type:complete len:236 (-) Transcript_60913:317-1024(-)
MHRQGLRAGVAQQGGGDLDPGSARSREDRHLRLLLAVGAQSHVHTPAQQSDRARGHKEAAEHGRERGEHGLTPQRVEQETEHCPDFVPEQTEAGGVLLQVPRPVADAVGADEAQEHAEENLRALEADVHREAGGEEGLAHEHDVGDQVRGELPQVGLVMCHAGCAARRQEGEERAPDLWTVQGDGDAREASPEADGELPEAACIFQPLAETVEVDCNGRRRCQGNVAIVVADTGQ